MQTYVNMEIIVLDDASNTNIRQKIGCLTSEKPIIWMRSDSPSGVSGARNKLIRASTSDLLFFLDDDAYFEHEFCVERAVDCFRTMPTVGIVAFKITLKEQQSNDLQVPFSRRIRKNCPGLSEKQVRASYYVGAAHAIRGQVFESGGLYQENLVYGHEELDLSYTAIQRGFEIIYTPAVTVTHMPEKSVIQGSELFYNTRNRIWIAYKHLPQRFLINNIVGWLVYYGIIALKHRQFTTYLRAIIAGIIGLPKLIRRPLNAKAIHYLKCNFGRLWY